MLHVLLSNNQGPEITVFANCNSSLTIFILCYFGATSASVWKKNRVPFDVLLQLMN